MDVYLQYLFLKNSEEKKLLNNLGKSQKINIRANFR